MVRKGSPVRVRSWACGDLQGKGAAHGLALARLVGARGTLGETAALLLQPDGFEGLGAVEVLLNAPRLAAFERDDVCEFHFHRGPAVSAVARKPRPDEHQVTVR